MGLDSASTRRRSRRLNFIVRRARTAGPKNEEPPRRRGPRRVLGNTRRMFASVVVGRRRCWCCCWYGSTLDMSFSNCGCRRGFKRKTKHAIDLWLCRPPHIVWLCLFMFYIIILSRVSETSVSSVFTFINKSEQICSICGPSWDLYYRAVRAPGVVTSVTRTLYCLSEQIRLQNRRIIAGTYPDDNGVLLCFCVFKGNSFTKWFHW